MICKKCGAEVLHVVSCPEAEGQICETHCKECEHFETACSSWKCLYNSHTNAIQNTTGGEGDDAMRHMQELRMLYEKHKERRGFEMFLLRVCDRAGGIDLPELHNGE